MTWLAVLGAIAALAWLVVLVLPWRPWSIRERVENTGSAQDDLAPLTALIPARNEADTIELTLNALARQGRNLRVLVIDDESGDATARLCRDFASALAGRLAVEVVDGDALPPGWGGKLWALHQGLARVDTQYTLLLDADIELEDGFLPRLIESARTRGTAMTSVMAELRCAGIWERLLVPPFIFFFKLIYPFARVNDSRTGTAAAAGGCILIETEVLRSVGGFESVRGALIDDCSLARLVKDAGHALWLGMSHAVTSHRRYERYREFARMVERTAFTQLKYSTALLLAVTALLVLMFVVPLLGLISAASVAVYPAALALIGMSVAFLPTVRFYGLPTVWVLTLPVAATLFLGMTWISALNYWRGVRAEWKDRTYASD